MHGHFFQGHTLAVTNQLSGRGLHKAPTWQMIGCCLVPILLTADAHFSARLSAFFYWTRCFENSVPFNSTTPIYLINLLWKLGLGSVLDSELHYFSIFFTENKESEQLSFREFHER